MSVFKAVKIFVKCLFADEWYVCTIRNEYYKSEGKIAPVKLNYIVKEHIDNTIGAELMLFQAKELLNN